MSNLAFDFAARGAADFSLCGRYRYSLTRRGLGGIGTMLMLLCNPSSAGADSEDNTSRRCIGFARREDMDTLVICNPFAYCATEPADLVKAWRSGANIIGPDNDRKIAAQVELANVIVIGCGTPSSYGPKPFQEVFRQRVEEMVQAVRRVADRELVCLGTTAEGWPRHPRLLRADAPLVPWELPR